MSKASPRNARWSPITGSSWTASGKLIPAPSAELAEPLVVRPTSETIIGAAYARWVQSYRDLPILINQWANVVRWEMRPRLFLRTVEFLWQEGHTAHETSEEAIEETERMLGIYETFARDHLALPVICGEKTANERFPGAQQTLSIEAMVQDRKAIQAGTSHFLGQNFSRASGIEFTGRDGTRQLAWTTSWGATTRLIGTVVMMHGDDDGAVIPPRVAPTQIVILPVSPKEESRASVHAAAHELAARLREQSFHGERLAVEVDGRELPGGTKNWEWIKKGAPIRVELGPRDLEKGTIALARRDRPPKDKSFPAANEFVAEAPRFLESIQAGLLESASKFRRENTVRIDREPEFREFFTPRNAGKPEIHGGFALCHWAGDSADENRLREELKVTIRCIPRGDEFAETGTCFLTGKPSSRRVVFAKSY